MPSSQDVYRVNADNAKILGFLLATDGVPVTIVLCHIFSRFSQNCENVCQLRHVRLSVRMEQLGSHLVDFNEI